MKTLIIFCRKTGRILSRYVDKLIHGLTANGQLRISIAIGVPFIVRFELGYCVDRGRKKKPA